MKIKIDRNVVHAGKVLKKDSVHDLPRQQAELLIEGKHASEHTEPKPPPPPPTEPPK